MTSPAFALVSLEKGHRGKEDRYLLIVTVDHYTTMRFDLGTDHPDNTELREARANIPERE